MSGSEPAVQQAVATLLSVTPDQAARVVGVLADATLLHHRVAVVAEILAALGRAVRHGDRARTRCSSGRQRLHIRPAPAAEPPRSQE